MVRGRDAPTSERTSHLRYKTDQGPALQGRGNPYGFLRGPVWEKWAGQGVPAKSNSRGSNHVRQLLKEHLVWLRQIEGFPLGLPQSQSSTGPVDFDHVAVGVVEVEGYGHTVD